MNRRWQSINRRPSNAATVIDVSPFQCRSIGRSPGAIRRRLIRRHKREMAPYILAIDDAHLSSLSPLFQNFPLFFCFGLNGGGRQFQKAIGRFMWRLSLIKEALLLKLLINPFFVLWRSTASLETMPRARYYQLKRMLQLLGNQSEDCLYLNIYAPSEGFFYFFFLSFSLSLVPPFRRLIESAIYPPSLFSVSLCVFS